MALMLGGWPARVLDTVAGEPERTRPRIMAIVAEDDGFDDEADAVSEDECADGALPRLLTLEGPV